MPAPRLAPLSIDQFLDFVDAHPGERWELIDGHPVAMAGPTLRHALIAGNIAEALGPLARAKGCRVLRDMFLRAAANDARGQIFDPDVMIRCGPARDLSDRIVEDPKAVFEVLSPSTMLYDRGAKLDAYLRTASLEFAALIYPRELRVEVWRRGTDGAWPEEPQVLKQVSDVLTVDLVDAAVPLAAIYEGIDLAD